MERTNSKRLDSFELTIADIAEADLDALHALSMSVGWPHRAEDWQMVRELGKGIVARDAIDRVLASAMWFNYAPDFTNIGMVITSPRLQMLGAGLWMMNHVLARTGSRAIGLNATRSARRLYGSLGFVAERTVYQCNGEAVAPPEGSLPPGTRLRTLTRDDLDEIIALDLAAYNADRTHVLARLLGVSKGVALVRGDRMAAYSLCRRFGRGHLIGPVVAANDADAIAVTRPHVADHAGSFLRLDTRQKSGAFAEFLAQSGLPVFDTVTSMSLRRPWLVEKTGSETPIIYGLATQALG
ncbi:N-acetyltransferase [Sinorhizobium fredii]|uniref:N-acetyltransferase n=1 Tax=Rhizobium fredii TaxID=380 RepID=A0A844A573_RHIFR|nr:N-acetyltransferase [Sinorhizobium fredii]ASY72077.1 Histone acetyltransferase HPA2-related acetyltransferase [Sinorhizobium fredii CCBAU 83666]MQX08133.1 N-acetyltransferase [Sinorhizobium fredii]GEC30827.1 N-acetyltransferase [Sinorhizobium fredii]